MEQMLGRSLRSDERVHHMNGDRADNRPENLELWVLGHPAGQRVTDKVEWALGIITRYAPELLNQQALHDGAVVETLIAESGKK